MRRNNRDRSRTTHGGRSQERNLANHNPNRRRSFLNWKDRYFSVFVGKISKTVTESALKDFFSPHGTVVDVFIKKKGNGEAYGETTYGFVRFLTERGCHHAIRNGAGRILEGQRLIVDFAKSLDNNDRYVQHRRQYPEPNKAAIVRNYKRVDESTSYAQVVSRDNSKNFRDQNPKVPDKPHQFKRGQSDKNNIQQSAPTKLEGVDQADNIKIRITSREQDNQWLKCCIVGTIKSLSNAVELKRGLVSEGIECVDVRFIGGLDFLVVFDREESMLHILKNSKPKLLKWFMVFDRWSPDWVNNYVIKWVFLKNIPLHLWNISVFKRMGDSLGLLLKIDPNTTCRKDLVEAKLLVAIHKNNVSTNSVELVTDFGAYIVQARFSRPLSEETIGLVVNENLHQNSINTVQRIEVPVQTLPPQKVQVPARERCQTLSMQSHGFLGCGERSPRGSVSVEKVSDSLKCLSNPITVAQTKSASGSYAGCSNSNQTLECEYPGQQSTINWATPSQPITKPSQQHTDKRNYFSPPKSVSDDLLISLTKSMSTIPSLFLAKTIDGSKLLIHELMGVSPTTSPKTRTNVQNDKEVINCNLEKGVISNVDTPRLEEVNRIWELGNELGFIFADSKEVVIANLLKNKRADVSNFLSRLEQLLQSRLEQTCGIQ